MLPPVSTRRVASGARNITVLVVYVPSSTSVTPCGACRQVLREFCADALAVCTCDGDAGERHSIADLLPRSFDRDKL